MFDLHFCGVQNYIKLGFHNKRALGTVQVNGRSIKKANYEQKSPVGYAVALAQILKKRKERKRKKP